MEILTPNQAVCKRMKQLLKEKHMTLYKLALNSGVLHATLNRIANNVNKSVNLSTLIQIANGLDMEVWEFLNDPLFKEDALKL